MLPKSHYQAYQQFLNALLILRDQANSLPLDAIALLEKWQLIQQVFQSQILKLNSEELDLAIAPRWQSLQTEIHRTLRLLEADMMFLRSSRQSATVQRHLVSLRDRLETLLGYCQVLLGMPPDNMRQN
jgi:hypothetical protein